MKTLVLLLLVALSPSLLAQDQEAPTEPPPGYRKFTAKNGKTLIAKVVSQLEDGVYTFDTPEGKSYKMSLDSFSKSDQRYLEYWQPDFAVDLSKMAAGDALPKMGYTAVSFRDTAVGMIVMAKVGDATLKLVFDPKSKFTILDIESADMAGLTLRDSSQGFNTPQGQVRAKEAANAKFVFGGGEAIEATVLSLDLSKIGGANIQKEADGILGSDMLPKLNALVDFGSKTLYVKP